MTSQYIIYCDESDEEGKFYSNFYGGCIFLKKDHEKINQELKKAKSDFNITTEAKWSKVDKLHLHRYINLIDFFLTILNRVKLNLG